MKILKFLDPYTKNDYKIYCGREEELALLYEKVKSSPITLLYGLSGTGKTSLIMCGLSNKFDDKDWKPFIIRRGNNMSIIDGAKQAILLEGNPQEDILERLTKVYYKVFRPLYLIFDQFEELFIYGDKTEKQEFINLLKRIKSECAFVKVILVLREEYFVHLDDFEEGIPEIFQSRVRLEPMKEEKAVLTIIRTCKSLGMGVSGDLAKKIIENVTSKSKVYHDNIDLVPKKIELPYLQVYVKEMYKSLEPKLQSIPSYELLELTEDDLPKLGIINDVLTDFIDKCVKEIQTKIFKENEQANRVVWDVLYSLISYKGTKQEKTIQEIEAAIV